jgi:hypothetical protein
MLVPAGFPSGEKQFEGSALKVGDFETGKLNVCFAFTGTSVGWGGKVGYWDGAAWKLLDTAISTPAESQISWACATAAASGEYAFIKWVVDPSLLPKETVKPAKPNVISVLLTLRSLSMEHPKCFRITSLSLPNRLASIVPLISQERPFQ